MNKTRNTLGCLGVIIGFVLVLVLGASVYLLSYALRPEVNKGRDYAGQLKAMKTGYPWIASWVDSVTQTKGVMRDTTVTSPDGDRHHGVVIAAPVKTALPANLHQMAAQGRDLRPPGVFLQADKFQPHPDLRLQRHRRYAVVVCEGLRAQDIAMRAPPP